MDDGEEREEAGRDHSGPPDGNGACPPGSIPKSSSANCGTQLQRIVRSRSMKTRITMATTIPSFSRMNLKMKRNCGAAYSGNWLIFARNSERSCRSRKTGHKANHESRVV